MAAVLILSNRKISTAPRQCRLEALQHGRAIARQGLMTNIEMNVRAALYLGSDWHNAKQEGARVFPTAAQAIRFAMEEAAPVSLRGARLIVGDRSLAGDDIMDLYRSSAYPFRHKFTRKYRPSRTARQLEKLAS